MGHIVSEKFASAFEEVGPRQGRRARGRLDGKYEKRWAVRGTAARVCFCTAELMEMLVGLGEQ